MMQFSENYGNARKYRDIKLVATERRRNYLVSEPNYNTKFFYRTSFSNRNEKTTDFYKQTCQFRAFNTQVKENINLSVLV